MKLPRLLCLLLFLFFQNSTHVLIVQAIEGKSKEKLSIMEFSGPRSTPNMEVNTSSITMFMCGDVMTGRGIDQVLPHPSKPKLYERYVKDARRYVEIAERMSGPIPRPVDFSYVWGDALKVLERKAPDFRLINLETSITESDDYWKGKGINYRMHPKNIFAIKTAGINVCSLANNHVLDWGYSGLEETLETLREANIVSAGAGWNLEEATAPAIFEVSDKGRVIVFSFGSVTSGVPRSWVASDKRPGVNLLGDFSGKTVRKIGTKIKAVKQPGDIVVASIHWGGNWGYAIPRDQRQFAHNLIDQAGVDVIHGHSSHHVKGIEVYKGKPVLYGCGDFINDYEGIGGYEEYRNDLGLMYFVSLDTVTGSLISLDMIPTQMKRFRVNQASRSDITWLMERLNRECKKLGTQVQLIKHNTFRLNWN